MRQFYHRKLLVNMVYSTQQEIFYDIKNSHFDSQSKIQHDTDHLG